MSTEPVSESLCNARNGEVLKAIGFLDGKMERLLNKIEGNGTPGMAFRLSSVESDLKRLADNCMAVQKAKQAAAERMSNRAWDVVVKVAPWLVGAVGAAYGLIQHG